MYSNSLSSTARADRSASVAVVRLAALALATMFASGCALLSDSLDRAAKGAGKMVTYYCENVTVPEIREEIRAKVNAYAAPNSVAVECAEGGPVLRSGSGEAISAPQPNEAAPSAEAPTAYNMTETMRRLARAPIIIISKDGVPRPKPRTA